MLKGNTSSAALHLPSCERFPQSALRLTPGAGLALPPHAGHGEHLGKKDSECGAALVETPSRADVSCSIC